MPTMRSVLLQIRKHCYLSMCILMICIGLFYLACATLITVIPHYQQEIAKEFSILLNKPVDFSDIKFSWRGFRVYARVYNVDIGEHDSDIHIDNINKVELLLHPIKSLIHLKPELDDITINGGKFYLDYSNYTNSSFKYKKEFSEQSIERYINKVVNNAYLKWFNIHKINLKNTSFIITDSNNKTKESHSKKTDEQEYVLSELKIYNSYKYNYIHGKVYKVNKQFKKNKQRESLELAIRLNKYEIVRSNKSNNTNKSNKFYLSTNSEELGNIVNGYLHTGSNRISKLEFDNNTWFKVWGTINGYNYKNTKFIEDLQFSLNSPELKIVTKTEAVKKKEPREEIIILEDIDSVFSYYPEENTRDNKFKVIINSISAKLAGTEFNIHGNINKYNSNDPASINIYAQFGYSDLKVFFGQLPETVIGHNTSIWLKQHVKKGWLGKSEIIWRGSLDDSFPYDIKHDMPNGVFNLKADILNSEIDYDTGVWPKIYDLNAVLTMRGREIVIESKNAAVSSSKIDYIKATISDLGTDIDNDLLINGNIISGGEDLHSIIATTPLNESLDGVNKSTSFTGLVNVGLNLVVPLSDKEDKKKNKANKDKKVKIAGDLEFKDNTVVVKNTPFEFNKFFGKINFTDNIVNSTDITAMLNKRKANFSIINKGNGKGTFIELNSWLDTEYLAKYYNIESQDYLHGVTGFDLDLNINKNARGKEQIDLHATSSLIGIDSKLPSPYSKNKQQIWPLDFYLEYDFNNKTKYSFVFKNVDSIDNKLSKIDYYSYGDKPYINADISMLSGKIYLIRQYNNQINKIKADLTRLNIKNEHDEEEPDSADDLDYIKWPDLNISVDNFYYNKDNLGRVKLITSADITSKEFNIRELNIDNSMFSLDLSGKYKSSLKPLSTINGDFKIHDLANTVGLFGGSDLKDKIKLHGNYNLTWNNQLHQPKLRDVSGKIKITSGHGRISDIEPGIGRVFSFFNIEVLDKRLRLDFSDVFEKGYKFDYATGDFTLNKGMITSNNLNIQAGSADIDLYGDIDLLNKNYNLKADVMPHVTTGLPIAAAIIGTPVAGAAVFLIDKILESPVDQLSERAYSITGPWHRPVVKKIEQKRGPLIELSWLNMVLQPEKNSSIN